LKLEKKLRREKKTASKIRYRWNQSESVPHVYGA